MSGEHLVFALGPVQGFITQSRRTADGWAGSYLISYLVARGLKAVLDSGTVTAADIVEPSLDKLAMWDALCDSAKRGLDARVAAVPNTVLVKTDKPAELGSRLQDAIEHAWVTDVAQVLYETVSSAGVEVPSDIWQAQIGDFWECYWAWGDSSDAAYQALAARKGLRSFAQVEASGDRCTVCGQRAAVTLPHQRARDTWATWAAAINNANWAPSTLVSPHGGERLCSVCLIKRLIPWAPKVVTGVNGVKRREPTTIQLWRAVNGGDGGTNPASFPSTSTMATLLYRAELIERARQHADLSKAIEDLHRVAGDVERNQKVHLGLSSVRPNDFDRWRKLKSSSKEEAFLKSDGDLWLYGEAVANEHKLSPPIHQKLRSSYKRMQDEARAAGALPPPIYYALLAMDGDKMGDYIRAASQAGIDTKHVSGLLNAFAQAVPGIVEDGSGRLIFAGGDDVLALLPLETALEAADELRKRFAEIFKEWHDARVAESKKI